ncbi:YtpI family protein [Jeotgalibacillus proteolyticus]|uniref:YtpI family protein n=1 Tax=Jeotgalibacillus proteolyticus TaxID=2082395 RepID=UPI003CF1CD7F
MPILVFIIILSAVAYLYFKTKQIRSPRPVEKQWQASRAGIALGLGMGAFGINQLFLFDFEFSTDLILTYVIAAAFILIGFGSAWMRYKAYKHLTPFLEKEDAQWKKYENENV